MYTLGAAAKATGKSKATISRAIKAGRLSATRSDGGGYAIDPAELHRVYPATGGGYPIMKRSDTVDGPGPLPSPETVALHRLLAEREETIRDLRTRLDATEHRLDTSEDERRKAQAQLTRLLTDQREPAAEEPAPLREALADAVAAERIAAGEAAGLRAEVERLIAGSRRPWWRRWFR